MSDDVGRPNALAKMREPFPDHQVGQIDRGNGVVLSYVGHAAITDRLLDADPEWTWKPLALDANGLPAFDRAQNGQPIGLWIALTVRGVTRLGYGDAGGKSGGNAIKEIIGDALRNAAMRFGAGLDLWHKGDLHGRDDETRDVAVDPLSVARAEVRKIGESKGWDLPTIEEQFKLWSDGKDIREASLEDTVAFTVHIRKRRAGEAA